MNVDQKSAVITGAARGVGRATALALAKLGCNVAINYRSSREQAEKTVSEIEALGVKALSIQGDVKDDGFCRRLMETAYNQFGSLDILVNNAGTTVFIPHDDLEQVNEDHWKEIFSTNVRAVFQCCRAARPLMNKSGRGSIINVGSIAGLRGIGSSIPYGASKATVHTLTLSIARVFGPTVRVNTIAPGFIKGEWLKEGLGDSYEEVVKAKSEASPLGKVCEPEDIANAALSLITGSDLVTGQLLVCDGGSLLTS